MKKNILLGGLAVLSLFFVGVRVVQAEITQPLYTVDYKTQVLFGDSVPVGSYYGLENYVADYVGGYLHMSYTLTHASGSSASYPAFLYIRSDDPSTVNNTTYLYGWLANEVNNNPSNPTDVYFIDIQFSATGYREVVTRGLTHTPFSDDTAQVAGMDGDTFIALANTYPMQNPPLPYSMSFQPMRLTEFPPTKILSLDISTSTNSVTVHDYIGPDDIGAGVHFTLGTSTNTQWFVSDTIYATTTGDLYHTFHYPTLPATLAGLENYIFYTDIATSSIVQSRELNVSVATPIIGEPGYSSTYADASQIVESSYDSLIQTLGTGLSGTLDRMDVQTSNSSVGYYATQPSVNIYECDDDTYGGLIPGASGCQSIYSGVSDDRSGIGMSTQSLYPASSSVVFNPSKYYFFQATGNNQFNTLPRYYGSSQDTVPGSCFKYKLTLATTTPCDTVADLYFRLYGIATTTPAPTGDSNVLFLPGLEASRLYYQKPNCVLNCEDKVWEPLLTSDVDKLYLNNSGESINEIYTKDVLNKTPLYNIYQNLILRLNGIASSSQIEWKAYAYDWRQGVQDIVDNGTPYQNGTTSLIATLQTLVSSSKNGKVTIIAHSNGGLLAKALIKKLQDMKTAGQSNLIDHIDNLVMVASPQIGTADAVASLLDGYGQAITAFKIIPIITTSQARNLAINMPSSYGLLPSPAYFNQSGIINPAVFSSSTPQIFISKYGSNINTYQEEHDFVVGAEGRTAPADSDTNSPLIGNSLLITQAENLHNTIDAMTIPSSIKVYDIAGWGKDTVGGMVYGNDSLDPIFTANGDGIVVGQSALYGDGTKYWLDLTHSKLDHKQIMEDPQVLSFIDTIIENTSSSTTLSTSQPIQVGNRLHLSVHSPVSIGVYDNQGNFTGKVCDNSGNCTIQEDIPGSTYLEFGEGKYVNLGQGDLQKAVLQGTDVGTFTFDYQIVTPSGQTTTASFQNIPVTTQTQALIDVSTTTGNPQLKLDVTGDGVSDFTLAPSNTFDPIIYLQIMRATIDSLDITDAKKKAFDNRVDNLIKLMQKGKVDKAKLKADKFVTVLNNVLSKPDPKHPKPKKLSKTDAQTLLDMLNGLLDNLS